MESEPKILIPPKKNLAELLSPYLYLFPALLILGIFMFYPFVETLIRATYLTDSFGKNAQFLGLGNYKELFTSPAF